MRSFIITLLLFPVSEIVAQEPIGFSDPADINPLLDYRLPDWGYSNLVLDFDLVGQSDYSKSNSSNRRNRSYSAYLNPYYNIYRESEERVITFKSNFSINYYDQYHKNEGYDVDQRKSLSFDTDINISADVKEYINSRFFLLMSGNGSFSYEKNISEDRDNGSITDQEDEYVRLFSSNTRLGIWVWSYPQCNAYHKSNSIKRTV